MAQGASNIPEDLEEVCRRFEEFRSMQSGHSRLPGGLVGGGCRAGQALRGECDGAGIAAGLHRPEETSGETGPA